MTPYASPEQVKFVSDPALVDLNQVGQTELVLRHGSKEETVLLEVVDTTAPAVEFVTEYTVHIDQGLPEASRLVSQVSDYSAVTVSYPVEPVIPADYGDTKVLIRVEDAAGNRTEGVCTFRFVWYRDSHTLEYGEKLTVEQVLLDPQRDSCLIDQTQLNTINTMRPGAYSLTGLLGEQSWSVAVTIRDTKGPELKLDTAGIYYITYTARDVNGNTASQKRKVIVAHDAGDTAQLLRTVAESLKNDPEEIRDFVHDHICYSVSFGGDDPLWAGLNDRSGNCYVHAVTLQAILEYKGYESQLIWGKDKTHYWVIVKIGDVWRHIDASSGEFHEMFSLMTDHQRMITLTGRDWDHSLWPACE